MVIVRKCKAVAKLATTATATAVAKGVAKDVLYFNAWWRRNLAVAWVSETTRAQFHRAAKHKNLLTMKFHPW